MLDHNGRPIPPDQADLGDTVFAIDLTFIAVSTVLVTIRIGTRLGITRNFGWDDATITLAQVGFWQLSCTRVVLMLERFVFTFQCATNDLCKSLINTHLREGLRQVYV